MKEFTSRIVRQGDIAWRRLKWLQGDQKEPSVEKYAKLKASLISNGFAMPFNVWEDTKGETWILDGHHRQKAMLELEQEGYGIPDALPANWVYARDRREAGKLVLVYSSIYARVTDESLYRFQTDFELDLEEVKDMIDLPDFNMDRFEAGYGKEGGEEGEGAGERMESPVISFQIIFDDVDQQNRWYNFVKQLRDDFPGFETVAQRLDHFLKTQAGVL